LRRGEHDGRDTPSLFARRGYHRPQNRLWHDVLIEEVRTDANGRLGTATVYEAGKLAPGPVTAWTAPPSNVAVLPDWSDPHPAEDERRTLHRLIGNAVVKTVSEGGGETLLPDLVASVSAALSVATDAVEDAIRFRIGTGTFLVTPTPKGRGTKRGPVDVLSISHASLIQERRRRFAASLSEEMDSQSRQIGNLIEHRATSGGYRETLLRRLLERHLPQRYHVATGFVHGCSRQLDILIYDRMDQPVFFREGELVVVHPDAVRAVIECKTTLDGGALCGALDLLSEVSGGVDQPPIFKGVFGFGGATAPTIVDHLRRYYRGEVNEKGSAYATGAENAEQHIQTVDDPVSAVCIHGSLLFEIDFLLQEGSDCLRPAIREVRNDLERPTQTAVFLERLLAHLREPRRGERTAPWLYDLIRDEQSFGPTTWIYDDCDWGPYVQDVSRAAFEARLGDYRMWRAGYAWPDHGAG
jgi:hypothetical protein